MGEIRRLWIHARWADFRILAALQESGGPAEAGREYGHIIGTAETWLGRVERRPARLVVWPKLEEAERDAATERVHAGYDAYLASLTAERLDSSVRYTNSAGQTFDSPVRDILLHAAMHGQYHRGKINLLLRQAGRSPAPVDYIAFLRGVPAAVTPPPR